MDGRIQACLWVLSGSVPSALLAYGVGWTRGHASGVEAQPSSPQVREILDYWPADFNGPHGSHHHICPPGCPGRS